MAAGYLQFTVTVKEQFAVFPDVSVARHATAVLPLGKVEPDGGVHETLPTPQLSVALGSGKLTTAVQLGLEAVAVMLLGQVMTGTCLS